MSSGPEQKTQLAGLEVETTLFEFVRDELTPGTGVDDTQFWTALADIVTDLEPANKALLQTRDQLQEQVDNWHRQHPGVSAPVESYRQMLTDIGYLAPVPNDFEIETSNVDPEISRVSGPQLVVPLDNSRFVLNAANSRWNSLYDALYTTDAIPQANGCKRTRKYNPIRGDKVIGFVRDFLDRHFGLEQSTHHHAVGYSITGGHLIVTMGDGARTRLLRPERLVGYTGNAEQPDSVLLRKNGLHLVIKFGEAQFIGRRDHANIYDVLTESALSAIMDCEDAVAAVDVEDKLQVYGNWLGLMRGTLKRTFARDGETIERQMEPDVSFTSADGGELTLPGRSLMLVRNVGPHLTTAMVTAGGEPIPETMLDAMVTALAAKHDLLRTGKFVNSRAGSIYVVKPKMHGPDEVAHAATLFARVEDALGLDRNTMKMGIMDEERRTSLNLKACVAAARERVFFINTGFLDRTGDEIHTCMEAGPVLPKNEMKSAPWLLAYEDTNVDVGLVSGMQGRAQIGKGMWAMPDEMSAMLEAKIGHPKAGASTAWVPSPIAATLHALHYYILDVRARQDDLLERRPARPEDMLSLPLLSPGRELSDDEIQRELDNNAQGILGYVARWVGQGIGCSKVPDINNVALMEDCATLRISSQHIANWLRHGIVSEAQVQHAMEQMAVIVDHQNASDSDYFPMSDDFDASIPFQAACDLVFKGRAQPNGYTEHILQARRREVKAAG